MYCVKCGNETRLYENLCKDCFKQKNKGRFFFIPDVIKITICNQCFAREKANHWEFTNSDKEAFQRSVNEEILMKKGIEYPRYSIDYKPEKTNVVRAQITSKGKFDDLEISEDMDTELRISYGTCDRCSRMQGNYYEAIIQIRRTDRKLDEDDLKQAEEIVHSVLDSATDEVNAFLSKSELIHGGEDFYIGSAAVAKYIAKRLAKEFGAKIKESSSLVGRKDGRDVYRITLIVRLPEYKKDEFIELNNNIFQILKIGSKLVRTLELSKGVSHNFKPEDLLKGKLLGGSELVFDAVVVLESETEVQVLDPENYSTVELLKPQNFRINGETVKIFKLNDKLYLIPNK